MFITEYLTRVGTRQSRLWPVPREYPRCFWRKVVTWRCRFASRWSPTIASNVSSPALSRLMNLSVH